MSNITLLLTLLSDKFDLKLKSLEKNAKEHFDLINTSVNLTTKVVSICTNISNKAKEKVESRQRTLANLANSSIKKQSKNGLTPKYNNSKILHKTPVRTIIPFLKSVSRFDKNGLGTKELIKSHSYGNLLNGKKNYKIPKRSNTVKLFSPTRRDGKFSTLATNGPKVNKGEKQKRPSLSSNKTTNNSFKVVKVPTKIKNIKMMKKQTLYKISRTLDNNDSIDRLFSIDNTINNDYLFNKNDPLLIMPITDKDFLNLNDQIDNNHNGKYKIEMFHIDEWADDHMITMLKYLTIKNILNLMLVNKSFSNKIKQYLLISLENEQKMFATLLSALDKPPQTQNENETNSQYNSKIQFTKKTTKAIVLLNDNVINKLFTETKIPSNDILLIYIIYFQMINHPIANEVDNKRLFWKKCCSYFILEANGKTGDLLERTLSNNLVITPENIYKLFHIIDGNLHKIIPSYFSKLCGATGLITFFIQDALDYLGISNDKKVKEKGYQLYEEIINRIDNKIAKIKSYMK